MYLGRSCRNWYEEGVSLRNTCLPCSAYARQELARADVVVACYDGQCVRTSTCDKMFFHEPHQPCIQVLTRADLMSNTHVPDDVVVTSSHDGTGVDELRSKITAVVASVAFDRSPATLRMSVGIKEAQKAIQFFDEAMGLFAD